MGTAHTRFGGDCTSGVMHTRHGARRATAMAIVVTRHGARRAAAMVIMVAKLGPGDLVKK